MLGRAINPRDTGQFPRGLRKREEVESDLRYPNHRELRGHRGQIVLSLGSPERRQWSAQEAQGMEVLKQSSWEGLFTQLLSGRTLAPLHLCIHLDSDTS